MHQSRRRAPRGRAAPGARGQARNGPLAGSERYAWLGVRQAPSAAARGSAPRAKRQGSSGSPRVPHAPRQGTQRHDGQKGSNNEGETMRRVAELTAAMLIAIATGARADTITLTGGGMSFNSDSIDSFSLSGAGFSANGGFTGHCRETCSAQTERVY